MGKNIVETSTLLSLLQFVALAAPAIAILMQVTKERELGTSVFNLLISSFLLIIFGGGIITFKLFTRIDEPMISGGILLILGSFVVLGIALAYSTITAVITSKGGMDLSDFPDYAIKTFLSVGPMVVSIAVIFVSFGGMVLLFGDIVNEYLSYGVFVGQDDPNPTMFFWAIAFLLAFQSIIKLIENGVMPGGDFSDVAENTLVVVFVWIVGYTVFVGPVFVIGFWLVSIKLFILPLQPSHVLLNAPYAWAFLIAVILFAVDVDLD